MAPRTKAAFCTTALAIGAALGACVGDVGAGATPSKSHSQPSSQAESEPAESIATRWREVVRALTLGRDTGPVDANWLGRSGRGVGSALRTALLATDCSNPGRLPDALLRRACAVPIGGAVVHIWDETLAPGGRPAGYGPRPGCTTVGEAAGELHASGWTPTPVYQADDRPVTRRSGEPPLIGSGERRYDIVEVSPAGHLIYIEQVAPIECLSSFFVLIRE